MYLYTHAGQRQNARVLIITISTVWYCFRQHAQKLYFITFAPLHDANNGEIDSKKSHFQLRIRPPPPLRQVVECRVVEASQLGGTVGVRDIRPLRP